MLAGWRVRWALIAASVLAAVPSRSAHADNALLVEARQKLDVLDFAAARVALERALATGTNTPAEVAEIYKLSGIVAGSLDDQEAAIKAFEKLLVLSPTTKLDEGTSPKIVEPFEAAAAFVASKGHLEVTAETSNDPFSVTLVVANDSLSLVTRAKAEFVVDDQPPHSLIVSGLPPIVVPLPTGESVKIRIAALDLFGNELAEVRDLKITKKKQAPPPPPPPPPQPPRSRPLYAQPLLWGGVAVAFGAAGAYFGFAYRSDRDDLDAIKQDSANHRFAEAMTIESRMSDHALYANLAFGAAAATALVGVYLFVSGAGNPDKVDQARTAVTPIAVPGGGGFVLARSF